jgi:ribosomal-protein-alanine N-acetyltransferase
MPRSQARNARQLEQEKDASGLASRGESAGESRLTPFRMSIADIPEVAALESQVFSDPWSADSFLAEIERRPEIGYPVVIRDESETLLAYAVAWFIVDEIHIGNIAVRPDRQGEGIGTYLLEHVLHEGRLRNMVYATLEVRASNVRARALYERFGFRKIAVRKSYYRDNREDALVLATALVPGAAPRRSFRFGSSS